MSEHKYREWCPFCAEVHTVEDMALHLDTCEAHAEYRAMAGLPDHAARIAELEAQLADFSALSLEVSTHWDQHLQTHADAPMSRKIAALTALAMLGNTSL